MKIVKSWKKNLKRTGALALATLVMSVGAAFVRAEDITLNQLGSDSTVEEKLNGETGNIKTVFAYQTGVATGYAANITWGDMIFVYDNGNYNPDTGCIETTTDLVDLGVEANAKYTNQTKEIQIEDEFEVYYDSTNLENRYYLFNDNNYYSSTDDTMFEGNTEDLVRHDSPSTILLSKYRDTAGNQYYESCLVSDTYFRADDHTPYNGEINALTPMCTEVQIPTFGHWYGFNGENNSVVIENLSTEDVYVSANATKNNDTSVVGDATFTLYTYDDHTGNDTGINCWEGVEDAEEYNVHHAANSLEPTQYYNSVEDKMKDLTCTWCKQSEYGTFGRTFKASVFNAEDSSIHTDIKAFYLNISGTPGKDLKTEFNEEEQPTANGNILGTITLNFGPSAEYPATFTPVLPTSNQVNQG